MFNRPEECQVLRQQPEVCVRCRNALLFAELLDGESCPNCKLVLS